MFKINNSVIKFHKEYTQYPRTKITTTIRTEYLEEYKKLIDSLNEEYSRGYDIMIEMLGENESYLNDFIKRLQQY